VQIINTLTPCPSPKTKKCFGRGESFERRLPSPSTLFALAEERASSGGLPSPGALFALGEGSGMRVLAVAHSF